MKEMKVKLTFTEEVLGMASANADVYDKFIASKAPLKEARIEENSNLPLTDESKGRTVFPRDEQGRPIAYNYQIKGYFKDACGMLRYDKDSLSSRAKAYRKRIDGMVFVFPREIPIVFDGEMGDCQRPLRAQTMQGERVTLAASETIPAGATMEFTVRLLEDGMDGLVREWLDYGELRGFGQWRNSGKGTFTWEELD